MSVSACPLGLMGLDGENLSFLKTHKCPHSSTNLKKQEIFND